MIQFYNTLSHKKEEFHPLEEGIVKLYVCGPTVYSDAHVGHAMSALVFDIIRRYLEFRGFKVHHVMNFTDVDDKIIIRANQMGMDPFELAEGYIQDFTFFGFIRQRNQNISGRSKKRARHCFGTD